MDLAAGLGQLGGAELDVLGLADGEMVVGFDFHLAVAGNGQVFLCPELAVAVGLDGVVTFVADANLLVVLDVFVPVALGVDVDLFLALAVFDAQFVVAATARAAQGLEHRAGLVGRQVVGDLVLLVVQAAGYQRLVGIAFEEGHQHFHADPRNGDAAIAVAGPAGADAQPAAGLVIGLAVAIPVKLDLYPSVLVAVDLFAGRSRDHGGLAAEHLRFRMIQWRAKGDVPGRGAEAVTVALDETVTVIDMTGDRLFQHLRLLAFVQHLGEQPEVVPFPARVVGDLQQMAADQSCLIAIAFGQAIVVAMPFQCALRQVLAAGALGEAAGVVVVFQVGLRHGVRRRLSAVGRFHP
ncbi:hypothetical protein OMR07_29295, partial [Methylobacterium organophilum]|nr:hypothetical protein [Methylobacterium organophilum]